MADDVPSTSGPSMTRLVSGIIDDTQRLLNHQVELLKLDLRKDLREAKEAGMALVVAGSILAGGALLLLFMLVHLLSWAVPTLPLWGCFGIVGGLVTLVGGMVFYHGREKLDNLNPLPEESVQGMKENLQWKTNPN